MKKISLITFGKFERKVINEALETYLDDLEPHLEKPTPRERGERKAFNRNLKRYNKAQGIQTMLKQQD